MKTVGVLVGIYQGERGVVVEVSWQRQLDDVSGAGRISVQLSDHQRQLILAGRVGQLHLDRGDADLRAVSMLARDVGTAAGIVADENSSKARYKASLGEH